LIFKDYME